jgi:hypothetical protein
MAVLQYYTVQNSKYIPTFQKIELPPSTEYLKWVNVSIIHNGSKDFEPSEPHTEELNPELYYT